MAWNEPGNNGKDRDPWGGRNDDQGPPDIDEIIKSVSRKLNGLFGGGKSGQGSGGAGGSGFSSGLFGGVIVLLIVIWAAGGIYSLDESERGVVMRLGKLQDDVVQPGLNWNPPLIDSVEKVNVTQVKTREYTRDMLTTDENIVTVSIEIQYIIEDPAKFVVVVRDPELSLDNAAESAIRHVVGGTPMNRVLTEGRADVAAEIRERLQRYMTSYDSGISVNQVLVRDARPPQAVQGAFNDVIKAREDEQRVQNEALAYANRVIPVARGEAQRIIEQANAYRDEVIARAEGEASRFEQLLGEYEKSPQVMRDRLYIDAMQSVFGSTSKVLVDVEGGNNMFYVPLDKIMQQSQSDSAPVPLTPQQVRELSQQVARDLQSASTDRRVQSSTGRGVR
ncbi:MAG: FtsH protease activity modulator HflK [Pseudohongiellaceae bacterium]|nr:FtsH protease activity modulator HflK [Pseudohongiellaceae bacterium]